MPRGVRFARARTPPRPLLPVDLPSSLERTEPRPLATVRCPARTRARPGSGGSVVPDPRRGEDRPREDLVRAQRQRVDRQQAAGRGLSVSERGEREGGQRGREVAQLSDPRCAPGPSPEGEEQRPQVARPGWVARNPAPVVDELAVGDRAVRDEELPAQGPAGGVGVDHDGLPLLRRHRHAVDVEHARADVFLGVTSGVGHDSDAVARDARRDRAEVDAGRRQRLAASSLGRRLDQKTVVAVDRAQPRRRVGRDRDRIDPRLGEGHVQVVTGSGDQDRADRSGHGHRGVGDRRRRGLTKVRHRAGSGHRRPVHGIGVQHDVRPAAG